LINLICLFPSTLKDENILKHTVRNIFTKKILFFTVESWLDERGHSLVPLNNPGSDPEMSLESGEHGTLLGR